MRPTNTQVKQFEQAAPANVPQVARDVNATPVQFAVDESKFRQLATLENQLATFNNGAMASAKLDDRLQQQRDAAQAQMDFLRDPNASGHSGSGYYYQAMMGLHADKAALDVESQIRAEHTRLLENPDELMGTDVAQHMDQFSKSLYAGLDDPIVASKVLKSAQGAASSAMASLSGAKSKLVKEDTLKSAWGVAWQSTQNATSPEDLAQRMGDFVTQNSGLIGQEDALGMVTQALSNAVAEAPSGAVAAGYLAALDTKQADGSTLAEKLGMQSPELAGAVTKMRSTVGNLKAADTAREIQAQKDAIAAHNARVKEQQDVAQAKADALLDSGAMTDLAQVKALVDNGQLSEAASIRVQDRYAKGLLKAKDLEVAMNARVTGDVLSGAQAVTLREEEVRVMQQRINADPSTAGVAYRSAADTLSRSAPGQLAELNKSMFAGADVLISAHKPGQPLNPQLMVQLKAIGALNDSEAAAVGIPQPAYEALQMLRANHATFGGDLESAMQVTQTSLASGGGPVRASDAAEAAQAVALSMQDRVFSSDFSDEAVTFMAQRGKQLASRLDRSRYGSTADIERAIKQQLEGELVHVGGYNFGSGLKHTGNAGAIFMGNGLDKVHSRNYVEMGANALVEELRKAGHNVTIVPTDSKGSHAIVWKTAGNLTLDPMMSKGELITRSNQSEQRTPLSVTELAELGEKLETARLKSARDSHLKPGSYTHDLAVQLGELSKAHAGMSPTEKFITPTSAPGRIVGDGFNKPAPGASAPRAPVPPALKKLEQISKSTTQALVNKEKNSTKRQ